VKPFLHAFFQAKITFSVNSSSEDIMKRRINRL